jgi:hypothetical protein
MTIFFEIHAEFTININPPGNRENMIYATDAVELMIYADDLCHSPETTASTPFSDAQKSVAPPEEDLQT